MINVPDSKASDSSLADSSSLDPIFSDQAQPPTTQRPNFAPPNPYAKTFFQAAKHTDASQDPKPEALLETLPEKLIYDPALIEKYDRPGPRYTSYPTALELKPISASEAGIELDILSSRDPNTSLSLYFHIPFCRHFCYYCACNTIITKKNSDAGDYLDLLKQEIARKRALLTTPDNKKNPYVSQLHLGGGTPTFFSDAEITELWRFLHSQFEFAPASLPKQTADNQSARQPPNQTVSQQQPLPEESAQNSILQADTFVETGDYSIEIDPRELGDNTLKTLRQLGFNRLSFGVQDLDNNVQIAVNRVQSAAFISRVMQAARALEFTSINIDLIYGLPKQTRASFAATIHRIIDLSPDRLSIFNYAHLPKRFKAQQQINEADLPSAAAKLGMFSDTIAALTQAGYQYIGIDHFAKPDDALAIAQRSGELHRNFQGYTTHGDCDLLGFGVSAISQINSTVYANRGNSASHMLQNTSDLDTYKTDINAGRLPAAKHLKIGIKDRLRGYVIRHLLCHDRIDFKDLNQKFGIDAITYFISDIQKLEVMQQDKLIDIDAAGLYILPKGRLFARNVAMAFDSYLANYALADNRAQHFSKAL